GLISYEIGKKIGVPAYIVDPVVVDEFADISRISGHPLLTRISIFHALNQRAMAHQFCTEQGLQYENTNLVVVHMGGGISVGIHNQGRVIDANNALDGDGPFTPERSGGLPAGELVKLCFSGEHTLPDIKKMLKGKGGMSAYFDTNDMREISERAKKEPKVKLVLDAFVYQIAKEIGAMATAVNGKVDGIILTGGIAYDSHIVEEITKRVSFISRVQAYPGENELMALAGGALRVLTGKEKAKIYE
ncbi:MAG: butyrate kinase, partial [Defluviitaleaceae bacterium]|nr:butyrate kinase [Defluviitaleaceae bacterium]